MDALNVRECDDDATALIWKDFRYELHQHFKKFRSTEEARCHPLEDVTQEDWDWLCTFFDNKYFEMRPKKDPVGRAQLPYNHRAWSKSSLCNGTHEVEQFHSTHVATSHAEVELLEEKVELLRARTEELHEGMEELHDMARSYELEMNKIRGILKNQQERLRRLEERVFDMHKGNTSDSGPSNRAGHAVLN